MRVVTAIAAVAAVVVLGVGGWRLYEERVEEALRAEAEETAAAYLAAWADDDRGRLAELVAREGRLAAERHGDLVSRLAVTSWDLAATEVALQGRERAEVGFTAETELAGLGRWRYANVLPLVRVDDRWLVDWSPTVVHRALRDGLVLDRERSWHDRAAILDRSDEPLAPPSLRAVVGTVGEVDPELLEELGEPYLAGDTVGRMGLQRAFERRLAGRPSGEVVTATADGERVERLHRFEGEPGRPVRTTIHPAVQAAAASVVSGPPTAIVVVDPATGELLAVVNHPHEDWNRAMQSRYPPGSTFKVVTAAALLRDGVEPDDEVDCPQEVEISGWTFGNFEEMDLGTIDLRTATYESCNTAYVQLAADVDDDVLHRTAEDFGFNVPLHLPVPVRGGVFPEYTSVVTKAAAGFGQGQVEASPMHMATVAAAVAEGTWRAPILVLDPPQESPRGRDVSDVAPTLRGFMELVVSRGTAAEAGLPADVAGKTGTAEWGEPEDDDADLPTHAWFIGYAPWDDPLGEVERIAFAVIVEGGEAGGRVAAPLARDFLAALRG